MENNEQYLEIRRALEQTTLDSIMTKDVVAVHQDDHLSDVYKTFREKGVRHVPVVDDSRRLVGLMTERDFFLNVTPHRLQDGTLHYDAYQLDQFILRHVMIKEPFSLSPSDSLARAVVAMAEHKYGCVPLVDDDRVVVGIITQADILDIASSFIQS